VILPWRLARLLLQGDDRAELIPFLQHTSTLLLSPWIDTWGARCAGYNGFPLRAMHGDEGAKQCFTSRPAANAPAKVVLAATDHRAHVLQSFVNTGIIYADALPFSGHWNSRHDIRILMILQERTSATGFGCPVRD
jgi:hypothetical protein